MFKDKILTKLVEKYGPPPTRADRSEFLYEEIVESIIGQQLSNKAADTIFNRFLSLYPGKKFPRPKVLLETNTEKLRGAGMSYSKASYIKNVAEAFLNKEIDINKLIKMSDEDVIAELTKIKGVGRWTAEMILMFTFKRTDVFSLGDAGLRRAIKNLYKLEKESEILELSEKWKPNRSLACWYLWRSLENEPTVAKND
jgi:DNA-3-methyladenine glycosylase II